MVIRPREVLDSALHLLIAVPSAFGTELEYTPIIIVTRFDEGNEARKWVAICTRRIRNCRAGGDDDYSDISDYVALPRLMGSILSSVR
jgi:hypothetical protein